MILIRTNHDLQTSYLYEYTKPIIKEAQKLEFNVSFIEGKDIAEANLRKRIKTRPPQIIFFNGHGSSNCLYDSLNRPFININSADVFKKTITFARACDCLKILGKEAMNKGCFAFVGYKKKFFVARYHSTTCKPLHDPVAKPILECSNKIMIEILNRKTVNEAINSAHQSAAKSILELIYSKELWAGATLAALISNDQALDFEGDGEARIR